MPDEQDDKKVKDLIDDGTRADLERWFALPSFQQLADEGKVAAPPPEDPEVAAFLKRRAELLAAVDPALLEAHRRRVEPPDDLLHFTPSLELRVDPSVMIFDEALLSRQSTIADPREVEIPDELRDDLAVSVPQALLRDLHRPETMFDKQFEVVDSMPDLRISIAAVVAEALTYTRLELPRSTYQQACALIAESRDELHKPWAELANMNLPNRRVTE